MIALSLQKLCKSYVKKGKARALLMKFRSLKRVMAVVLTALLAVTAMPSGLTGLLSVKAAEPEITKTTTTYDFTKSGKWSNVTTVGAVLPDNYGIILLWRC